MSSSLSTTARNSFKSSSLSLSKPKFIWRFPPLKFEHLPSCISKRLSSFDHQLLTIDDELLLRQQLSILIYELASHLNVSFTCIYTAVIYMHRFFMLHSFQQCPKELVAAACLFLACKVNEMPRPLNELTRYLYQISNSNETTIPTITSEILVNYNQQIIDYENILLSTLGFCLHIEQPYLIITKISQTLSIPMEITQKAHDIATKSIFFTMFPMKYTTNLIACFALYLALKSHQINIPDNDDGSQWFHLLNEEFSEKLLKELADEFQTISMNKSSQIYQQRFEQLRQQKVKIPSQPIKPKSNGEQSNSNACPPDIDQYHYPIASTSGSVRSTTSSSSSVPAQQQANSHEQGLTDIHHHTPNRSSSMTIPHIDYSPLMGSFVHSSSSPLQPIAETTTTASALQSSSQYRNEMCPQRENSSAKPIPTLMTSSTCNTYHNSHGARYHTRYSLPTFRYASMSPTQRFFRPPPLPPPQVLPLPYHPAYASNYVAPSSYYPQQQTPLFYHAQHDSMNLTNKRLGEPPAPPAKRFRYTINTQQHY